MDVAVADTFSLEAYFFQETLDELRVEEGRARPAPARNRPLPEAGEWVLDVEDGEVGPWRELTDRANDVANLRIPADPVDCRLEFEVFDLGDAGSVPEMIALPDGRLLATLGFAGPVVVS